MACSGFIDGWIKSSSALIQVEGLVAHENAWLDEVYGGCLAVGGFWRRARRGRNDWLFCFCYRLYQRKYYYFRGGNSEFKIYSF